ncbi:DUF6086 family protein [Pilimelia columellifera]|uniref:DUF6086 family protein n=1 Tax=Pilimelia columellifera TaxID=706574 RepID=UPI0031DEF4A2
MSQYFQVGDLVLWNPSSQVAGLFFSTSEAVAVLVDVPTRIVATCADEYDIDLDVFVAFVDALVSQYRSSSHPILRSLLEGFTATALVLVDRAGRAVPLLPTSSALDPRDVSVGAGGVRPLGDVKHLQNLAGEHARAMPC